jgi:hypothetical protein
MNLDYIACSSDAFSQLFPFQVSPAVHYLNSKVFTL